MILLASTGGTLVAVCVAAGIAGVLLLGALVGMAVGMVQGRKNASETVPQPIEQAEEPEQTAQTMQSEEPEQAETAQTVQNERAQQLETARGGGEEPVREEAAFTEARAESDPSDPAGEVIAVSGMSPALRAALGVEGAAYDGKWYSVKYSYGFNARIALSKEEVREFYAEIVNEIAAYPKMKCAESWRQQRIYTGRKKLGVILFKGKKLCLALALDPMKYAETKYRGKDVSSMRRFAETPMLFGVGTARKLKYAKYLIGELARENGLDRGADVKRHIDVPQKTRDELLAEKQIKAIGREVPAPREN